MATTKLPTDLPGSLPQYETRRGVMRRLHNRRVVIVAAPDGNYQLQLARALETGEAAELRRAGHQDTAGDYIVRDRVRYSLIQLTAGDFEAMLWCWTELQQRQQKKRA